MLDPAEVRFKIEASLKVIDRFGWLLDSYITDFFVEDLWSRLPTSWCDAFENVEPPELGGILSGNEPNRVLPLSFWALLKVSRLLSLPREQRRFSKTNENLSDPFVDDRFKTDLSHKKESLNNVLLKKIKLKKKHEISLLANLVNETALENRCCAVVDIGSGLGHLARILSYKFNLRTIGVEAQNSLTENAAIIDDQLKYTVSKYLKNCALLETLQPQHINLTLTENSRNMFTSKLKSMLDSYGIVGLHTCGDLGPLLIKTFCETPDVRFICAVGCCYMKLTCDGKTTSYPMSEFTLKVEKNTLSRESRELACHAIESYCSRLNKGAFEDLQIHCYRAVLEKLLVSKWPHMKRIALKSVKHYNTLTFERYCELALEKVDVNINKNDLNSEIIAFDLLKWKRVVIFYTLRLIMAPLVESVILLDRMLYLMENGIQCEIIPLFDPSISPRNHVLVAQKF